MADANKFLTGKFKAEDIKEDLTLTISKVKPERMQSTGEEKLVLSFEETGKGLVLGTKANLEFLIDEFGDDTDDWVGKEIVLYSVETSFGSKPVQGIRLKLAS